MSALESFYGGKQGISPVIKARFKYISENDSVFQLLTSEEQALALQANEVMDTCFADDSYEDVWYGEYCIIDTVNKNNKNNGRIYRRTLKNSQADDDGLLYAEYIGQIVGPVGGYPVIKFSGIDSAKTQAVNILSEDTTAEYIYPDSSGVIHTNQPASSSVIGTLSASVSSSQLVPGSYIENNTRHYNDDIQYTWVSVRNNLERDDGETFIYMGFQIPFSITDFSAISLNYSGDASVSRLDDDTHPFYRHWQIAVPRGIRGVGISNIRLATYGDFSNLAGDAEDPFLYDIEKAVTYNIEDDSYTIPATPVVETYTPDIFLEESPEQIIAHRDVPFFVYDFNFISTFEDEQETITCYLGAYKDISSIELEEDGDVVVTYSTTETDTLGRLTWIEGVAVDTTTGVFTVTNNRSNIMYEETLPFIESIETTSTGSIIAHYTDGSSKTLQTPGGDTFEYQYVDQMMYNDTTGEITYRVQPSNEAVSFDPQLYINNINHVVIDKDHHLLVDFSSTKYKPSFPTDTDLITQAQAEGINYDPTTNMGTYRKRLSGQWITIVVKRIDNNGRSYRYIWADSGGWQWRTNVTDTVYQYLPGDVGTMNDVTIDDTKERWWLDLGLVRVTVSRPMVVASFNFIDYFGEIDPNTGDTVLPAEWDTYSSTDILGYLNSATWEINGETVTNPYFSGAIVFNNDNYAGSLMEFDGDFYFYDYNLSNWVVGGTLDVNEQTNLVIGDATDPTNQNLYVPSGLTLANHHFVLLTRNINTTTQTLTVGNGIWT